MASPLVTGISLKTENLKILKSADNLKTKMNPLHVQL